MIQNTLGECSFFCSDSFQISLSWQLHAFFDLKGCLLQIQQMCDTASDKVDLYNIKNPAMFWSYYIKAL